MNSFIQFLLVISFICYDGIDPSPQKKLTKKQKGIIESLVSFADSLNGKTKSSSIILTKIATLKNDNVEFMPFYHLDIDKFYKDPTPENLLLSLYQPDTLAMLLLREKADNLQKAEAVSDFRSSRRSWRITAVRSGLEVKRAQVQRCIWL